MHKTVALVLLLCSGLSLWMGVGYLIVQRRINLTGAWLPALQWFMLSGMLGYLSVALTWNWDIAWAFVLLPFPAAVGLALIWRSDRLGSRAFLRRYPNGGLDVLLFRRPNTELQRRVRSKGR